MSPGRDLPPSRRGVMIPSLMSKARGDGIPETMERAEQALRRRGWFEAERLALKALAMARAADDFDAMARILLPLQEARRQRLEQAFELKKVRILRDPIVEPFEVTPGLYLVEPPLVGIEARRLRLLALEREVPVAVVCREPLTRVNTCPVVAIGPVTIRVRIDPPKRPTAPSAEWMAGALEQLGDAVIAGLDPQQDLLKRIDYLLACLEVHPDHEKLHQVLHDSCREAARRGLRTPSASVPGGFVEDADGDDAN